MKLARTLKTAGPAPFLSWLPYLLLGALLLPFLGKAVHMDDTLFLRMAEQVRRHPLDPYGFKYNWFGSPYPMTTNMQNPPLLAYVLAPFVNGPEWVMHLVLFCFAVGALRGSQVLARRFTRHDALAAVLICCCPAFAISASTLMTDVPMLCCWVWALEWWLRGHDSPRFFWYLLAGLATVAAFLFKYPGVFLVIILVADVAWRRPKHWHWLVTFGVIALGAVLFDYWSVRFYSVDLFVAATAYSRALGGMHGLIPRISMALFFLGGCLWPIALLVLLLASTKQKLAALLAWLVFTAFVRLNNHIDLGVALIHALYTMAALLLLALIAKEWRVWLRGPHAGILASWMLMALLFGSLLNWTQNGRSLLLLVPLMALLAAHLCERNLSELPAKARSWNTIWAGQVLAATLALILVQADYASAAAWRQLAQTSYAACKSRGARQILFEGHWGFQYYMEQAGATAFDQQSPPPAPTSYIVVPQGNSNVAMLPPSEFQLVGAVEIPVMAAASIMSTKADAGFYAAEFGTLPFALVPPPSQKAFILHAY